MKIEGNDYTHDINVLAARCQYFNTLNECENNDINLSFGNIFPSSIIKLVLDIIENGDIRQLNHDDIIIFLNNQTICQTLMDYFMYDDIKKQQQNIIQHMKFVLKNCSTYDQLKAIVEYPNFVDCDLTDVLLESSPLALSYDDLFGYAKLGDASYSIFKKKLLCNKIPSIIILTNLEVDSGFRVRTEITFNIAEIEERMENFSHGILSYTLMRAIDWNCTYISGGFLLSCITGEKYDWSDLDIWIYSKTIKECNEKTIEFIDLITWELNGKGYNKIVWSNNNNVLTMYCVGLNINLQIIMTTQGPNECIGKFDLDYIQCYYSNLMLMGTSWFLESLISKKIGYISSSTRIGRVVKALLKDYGFVENSRGEIVANIVNIVGGYKSDTYDELFLDEITLVRQSVDLWKTKKEIMDEGMVSVKMIEDVMKKYYYPSAEDFDDREKSERIIVDRIGHRDVYWNLIELEEKIRGGMISVFDPVYVQKDVLFPCGKEFGEREGQTEICAIEKMMSDVCVGNISEIRNYKWKGEIMLKYCDNDQLFDLFVRTDEIILSRWPLNIIGEYYKMHMKIKIWKTEGKDAIALFQFFGDIDERLSEITKHLGKKSKYCGVVKEYEDCDGKKTKYVNLKLVRGGENGKNILTEFYFGGKKIDVNDDNIGEIVKEGIKVRFVISIVRMFMANTGHMMCYPTLFLHRVDVN